MVEDIHISISALLRASTGLSQVVPEFIAGYVDFDRAEPSNIEEIEMLRSFLDIAPQDLALFTKMKPLWTGQRLSVSASLLNDSDCVACLTTVINYCLRFCDFSDTRWCKVGVCGRYYVRSLLVGVDKLVELAMKADAIAKWPLAGYHTNDAAHQFAPN